QGRACESPIFLLCPGLGRPVRQMVATHRAHDRGPDEMHELLTLRGRYIDRPCGHRQLADRAPDGRLFATRSTLSHTRSICPLPSPLCLTTDIDVTESGVWMRDIVARIIGRHIMRKRHPDSGRW